MSVAVSRPPTAAARLEAAAVALLRALPAGSLERVLLELGIALEHADRRADPRRCTHCSKGYVGHARVVELGDVHEWSPHPATRSSARSSAEHRAEVAP